MTWTRTGTPARDGFGRRAGPRLTTDSGEQREAQVVNEVERGDRDAVSFEPGVPDAGSGTGGRLVVQLGSRVGVGSGLPPSTMTSLRYPSPMPWALNW